MLTISSSVSAEQERSSHELSESLPRAVSSQAKVEGNGAKNAWYRGYEMGMTFCRLTQQLADRAGSKIDKETRCLERALGADFTKAFGARNVNVVDLGTGDGRKTSLVIAALRESGARSVRYVPVDTNPHISRYASFTILGAGKRAWTRREAELVFGSLGPEDLAEAEIDDGDAIRIDELVRLSTLKSMTGDLFTLRGVTVPMTGLRVDFLEELPKVVGARAAFVEPGISLFCLLGNTLGNCGADQRRAFFAIFFSFFGKHTF